MAQDTPENDILILYKELRKSRDNAAAISLTDEMDDLASKHGKAQANAMLKDKHKDKIASIKQKK